MTCGVIIAAAGRGTRMGASQSEHVTAQPFPAQQYPAKQFLELGDKPIILHTIGHFQQSPDVGWIILVTGEKDIGTVRTIVRGYSKVSAVIQGGNERQDSVWNGLQELRKLRPEVVLVHDAARPFINQQLIHSLVMILAHHEAATLAVPATETIKLADEHGVVRSTIDRKSSWIAQTPQAFRFSVLYRAYERAVSDQFYGTDDASLVERLGIPVKIVQGSYDNIKITTPEDLDRARMIASRITPNP